jgi:hypothetical protein
MTLRGQLLQPLVSSQTRKPVRATESMLSKGLLSGKLRHCLSFDSTDSATDKQLQRYRGCLVSSFCCLGSLVWVDL